MDYVAHTEEYKGYTINVRQDDSAESPREWDNLGTITAWHRNYNLSDERHSLDVDDFVKDTINDPKRLGQFGALPVLRVGHLRDTIERQVREVRHDLLAATLRQPLRFDEQVDDFDVCRVG